MTAQGDARAAPRPTGVRRCSSLTFRLDRGYNALRNGRSYGAFLIASRGLEPFPFGRRGSHCFGAAVEGKGSDDPETRAAWTGQRGERARVEIKPLTLKAGKTSRSSKPLSVGRGYVSAP